MAATRIVTWLNVFVYCLALGLGGCADRTALEEQIQSLRADRDELRAELTKLKAGADSAERDAAILEACQWNQWLFNFCPPTWVQAGEQARQLGYTGTGTAWTWVVLVVGITLAAWCLTCPLVLLYFFLQAAWVRRRIPSRAEVERASADLETAKTEAVAIEKTAREKAAEILTKARDRRTQLKEEVAELEKNKALLEPAVAAAADQLVDLEAKLDAAHRRWKALKDLKF